MRGEPSPALLLVVLAIIAVFVLALKTGAMPVSCVPPRHVISFVAADGLPTEECMPPSPSPPVTATNQRRP